ncbi:MAG: hypothetical protein LBD52_00820 [Prevotellaceae bacterium]|jgi:hypothetical protein|nr:hypothetical protein [Prevotellaceae bacterium]
MKKLLLSILFIPLFRRGLVGGLLLGCLFSACGFSDRLRPVELQCEYQTEPVGIDVPAPRFSWQLLDPKHVRGQAQTAYHILVASSPIKRTRNTLPYIYGSPGARFNYWYKANPY